MTLLEALAGAVIKQEEPYLARMPLFLSWHPKDLPLDTARSCRPATQGGSDHLVLTGQVQLEQSRQSTPVARTDLSWCTATQPLFEMSARLVLIEHLVQMAACVLGINALRPDFDLLISARLAAGNCQSASSEMLAMRQRRAAAEHDFSLLGKKKARNAG